MFNCSRMRQSYLAFTFHCWVLGKSNVGFFLNFTQESKFFTKGRSYYKRLLVAMNPPKMGLFDDGDLDMGLIVENGPVSDNIYFFLVRLSQKTWCFLVKCEKKTVVG